jgi:hypothetical protein
LILGLQEIADCVQEVPLHVVLAITVLDLVNLTGAHDEKRENRNTAKRPTFTMLMSTPNYLFSD